MNWERERVFDRRTVQRHIQAGDVSREEYDAFLSALEDVSHKIRAPGEGGDVDGFERDASPKPPAAASQEAPQKAGNPPPVPAALDDGWGISADDPPAPVMPNGPGPGSND